MRTSTIGSLAFFGVVSLCGCRDQLRTRPLEPSPSAVMQQEAEQGRRREASVRLQALREKLMLVELRVPNAGRAYAAQRGEQVSDLEHRLDAVQAMLESGADLGTIDDELAEISTTLTTLAEGGS